MKSAPILCDQKTPDKGESAGMKTEDRKAVLVSGNSRVRGRPLAGSFNTETENLPTFTRTRARYFGFQLFPG
jgi:hypothetical protein